MTDKELIRKEVERLKKEWSFGSSTEAKYRVEVYKELLNIIDSLPEESVKSIWHDSNKEQPKDGSAVAVWNGKSGEIITQCVEVYPDRLWAYMEDLLHKKEEPVSEELEEEIKRMIYDSYYDVAGIAIKGSSLYLKVDGLATIARHFAQWQKRKTINKACEWLLEELDAYDIHKTDIEASIERLKEALKTE